MTPSELKRKYEQSQKGYFFTRDNMSFCGDTMQNYGVRELEDCFELYRKKPVRNSSIDGARLNSKSAFFDKITFKILYNKGE